MLWNNGENLKKGNSKRSLKGTNIPDLDEGIKKLLSVFKGWAWGAPFLIFFFVVLWLASGIYIVAPDEVGVVKRFGKVLYITQAGPHWHLPYPVESVLKPNVTKIRKIEVGFRTAAVGPPARYMPVPAEALTLTGDENIVSVWFVVQYKVKDPINYLFNVYEPEEAVIDAAEAAMREVIGKSKIDDVLTVGKAQIQADTERLLQRIMDLYGTGINIERVQLQDVHPPDEVVAAFKDVASAREDKVRLINESESYLNDLLPKAKGKAAQTLNEAIAYKEAKINRAQGDASRFSRIIEEYEKAKDVTKKRLYLETLEKVFLGMNKVLVDKRIGEKATTLLPLGSLDFLTGKKEVQK